MVKIMIITPCEYKNCQTDGGLTVNYSYDMLQLAAILQAL